MLEEKVGVGEFALARAQPGEVEAEHGEAAIRQLAGDARGREDVFRAGEAVREQGAGARLTPGQVQPCGQLRRLASRGR